MTTRRLFALSDLHVNYKKNRDALAGLSAHPEDWLILAGDIGDTLEHLTATFDVLGPRFHQLVWVPGNHELWTEEGGAEGEARYLELVEHCRSHGVLTPEDPYPRVETEAGPVRVCPLFLLYDYSFRPDEVPLEGAIAWAKESGVLCADERRMGHAPFPDKGAWCRARLEATAARLEAECADEDTVLVNHFPLRRDLCRIPRIPRFTIWCGTRETEDWHTRFRARVVVTGHLHVRATDWRDGVRFEEVAVGYPRHWRIDAGLDAYLRPILPGPEAPADPLPAPVWHR